ncbi:MAG: hypothetical protein Q7J98_09085 [Kiritimatiellia bacterium]|nr:hypothetical protein [Kiritimatiellia bacterium]
MYNQEWEIKPRAIACKACQQPFADGQVYVSSLCLNGSEYERADCCEKCWQQNAVSGTFSVWKGTFQVVPPLPEVLKKETAESLLRKLMEKNDPEHRNAIFILAVMLERRRILAEKPARPPAPARSAMHSIAGGSLDAKALRAGNAIRPGEIAGGEAQKKDDQIMIRVYEHRKTGETFIISDPMLSLDQLEHVQEEVAALFSGQA